MISLSVLSSTVYADDHPDSQTIKSMVDRGDIVSILSLQERYPQLLSGRWLDIELEREHGLWVYEFEIINTTGEVTEVTFNAQTGELLEIEEDD